jgi:hypothetical protein
VGTVDYPGDDHPGGVPVTTSIAATTAIAPTTAQTTGVGFVLDVDLAVRTITGSPRR